MEQKGEVLYEISPKFEFLYELTTPMGRKMKSSFIAVIVGAYIGRYIQYNKEEVKEKTKNFIDKL